MIYEYEVPFELTFNKGAPLDNLFLKGLSVREEHKISDIETKYILSDNTFFVLKFIKNRTIENDISDLDKFESIDITDTYYVEDINLEKIPTVINSNRKFKLTIEVLFSDSPYRDLTEDLYHIEESASIEFL